MRNVSSVTGYCPMPASCPYALTDLPHRSDGNTPAGSPPRNLSAEGLLSILCYEGRLNCLVPSEDRVVCRTSLEAAGDDRKSSTRFLSILKHYSEVWRGFCLCPKSQIWSATRLTVTDVPLCSGPLPDPPVTQFKGSICAVTVRIWTVGQRFKEHPVQHIHECYDTIFQI
jgi:hypothetical protein